MRSFIAASIFSALLWTSAASAQSISAFSAQKIASREVNDIAKKSLVQIHGAKSSIGVTPIEWQVLFYDPYADQNVTKVTVAGSTITRIEQGYVQMQQARLAAFKQEEILEPAKLRKDSNDIIDVVKRSTELQKVKLSSAAFSLIKEGKGPAGVAVWTTRLWAMREGSDKEVEFGRAKVNAATGQILELKLDLKKLAASK
jgi:hypothetical protein